MNIDIAEVIRSLIHNAERIEREAASMRSLITYLEHCASSQS